MTLNDPECPIHLKVRFTDGTLDVLTLWLSDSAIRIQGGPKKVSQIIFAITLSTVIQFS